MFRNEIAAVPRFQPRSAQAAVLCRNCIGSGEVEKLDT